MTDISLPISFPFVYGENIAREYPNVYLSIERITPDVAAQMLETNIKNRKIKRVSLKMVEEAISNGEWSLNGEAIVFDESGKLIDGQHRLTSCVKTGKSIDVIVVRGIREEAQDTIDNGARRQLSDYIKMDGYKNYIVVASIGKMLARKDDLGLTPTLFDNNVTKRSIKSMRRFVNNCHDERIEPLISPIGLVTSRYKCVPMPLLGALFDEFRKAGEENFTEFVAQIVGKSAACMPVRLLQNKFVEHATDVNGHGKGYFKGSVLAAYIIKTWNAYMRGDEMKRLTYNPGGKYPESFPAVFLGYE